jgi:fructokinase
MINEINKLNMLGTGLVCLDIIKSGNNIRYYNGGSCGNVTAAFSFLGQRASVITRHYYDKAGVILNSNLKNIGVNQITFGKSSYQAPRIIEELQIISGTYEGHKFLLTCSECGQTLPKAGLLGKRSFAEISDSLHGFDVFYSDRSSPGIRQLRKIFQTKGCWTVYEPNSSRNINSVFSNALESDIVKLSAEKFTFNIIEKLRRFARKSPITLLVYTKGKEGLIFSYRKRDKKLSKWISLGPQPAPRILDTSGAGDWCTAGLLSALLVKNQKYKKWLTKDDIVSSLQFGQALAAISCAFVGGQGLIHADFNQKDLRDLLQPFTKEHLVKVTPSNINEEIQIEHCPLCLCPV